MTIPIHSPQKPRSWLALGGAIYGPYTGTTFRSTRDTDIEHIVARSEAHDSGLCAASAPVKAAFARDLLNLTLAHPRLNRSEKSGKDVAEWQPAVNACWFAARTLEVRRKYRLTIDRTEAAAVERILTNCSSTAMVRHAPRTLSAPPVSPPQSNPAGVDALALWDDNRNGRITCAEARRHEIAPVPRGHPAYRLMWDRDGDGVGLRITRDVAVVCRVVRGVSYPLMGSLPFPQPFGHLRSVRLLKNAAHVVHTRPAHGGVPAFPTY